MSTKIYSGYKLRKGVSLFDLQEKFYRVMRQTVQTDLVNSLTAKTVYMADAVQLGNKNVKADLRKHYKRFSGFSGFEEVKTFTLQHCLDYVLFENIHKKPDILGKVETTTCSLAIFRNKIRDEIYLYFFGKEEYEDVFKIWPEVEEFAYWNNADGPDYLTDEQWGDRYKAWNEAINLNKSLRTQGLVIDPIEQNDSIITRSKYKSILQDLSRPTILPTYENRVSEAIHDLLGSDFTKQLKLTKTEFTLDSYMDFIRDVEKRKEASIIVEKKLQRLDLDTYLSALLSS